MNYEVIADRDKGDDPQWYDAEVGDRVTADVSSRYPSAPRNADGVRIERPVPTTDEPRMPELVTLHLYRDTCVGGLFLSERELDRTLHEHVEALTIRRDRLPSPHPPTREQIAEALYSRQQRPVERIAWADLTGWVQSVYLDMADAVLALIQNGSDR